MGKPVIRYVFHFTFSRNLIKAIVDKAAEKNLSRTALLQKIIEEYFRE